MKGTSGIANYYGTRWRAILPDLNPVQVASLNRCCAVAEGYTVPTFTLQELCQLMKATLAAPYYVTGHQPQGQPFWLTVSIEQPRKRDDSQECRRVFHSSHKDCPPLQQLCKWFLLQLI